MSLAQIQYDSFHLNRTNSILESFSDLGTVETAYRDKDTGEAVKALTVSCYVFSLEYVDHDDYESDGFELYVESTSGDYVGCKSCKNYPHLKNTIKKIARLQPVEAIRYLKGE